MSEFLENMNMPQVGTASGYRKGAASGCRVPGTAQLGLPSYHGTYCMLQINHLYKLNDSFFPAFFESFLKKSIS